eukprot:TRINITY_DN4909_c0_g1_i6.p1 TRINITY_DN4909_c0_g1~~TRINITY_DN4909_c0_g1_i6.p1  ORF type:complete len:336 (+),score=50.69 TRINITY_DN4909_c0_g1_i6:592-1599(+)
MHTDLRSLDSLHVADLGFNPDGSLFACCTSDGYVHLYDADRLESCSQEETNLSIPILSENTKRKISKCTFVACLDSLAVGFNSCRDLLLYNILSLDSAEILRSPDENGGILHLDTVQGMQPSILASSRNGTVQIWDTRNRSRLPRIFGSKQQGSACSVHATSDMRYAIVGYEYSCIHVFDLRFTNQPVKQRNIYSLPQTSSDGPYKKDLLKEMIVDEERLLVICKFAKGGTSAFSLDFQSALQPRHLSGCITKDPAPTTSASYTNRTMALSNTSGYLLQANPEGNCITATHISPRQGLKTIDIQTSQPIGCICIRPGTEQIFAGALRGNNVVVFA